MGYTFWYRDGEQTAAAPKGFRSDAFHTFGDNNGGQTGATIKSRSSNACHTIRDNDGGQSITFHESGCRCFSRSQG